MTRETTPQPLRALITFIREARKAEEQRGVTAGEILFGSITHGGKKTLHRMALLTDEFVGSANQYYEIKTRTRRK